MSLYFSKIETVPNTSVNTQHPFFLYLHPLLSILGYPLHIGDSLHGYLHGSPHSLSFGSLMQPPLLLLINLANNLSWQLASRDISSRLLNNFFRRTTTSSRMSSYCIPVKLVSLLHLHLPFLVWQVRMVVAMRDRRRGRHRTDDTGEDVEVQRLLGRETAA